MNTARSTYDIGKLSNYHYNSGFKDGYEYCEAEYRERSFRRKQQRMREREKTLYFLKQKLYGLIVILFSIFSVWALDGDATLTIITVPLGLCLIFTKKRYLSFSSRRDMEDKKR